MATPAFGPEPEVVRMAGPQLVREVGAESWSVPMDGSTLSELAAFARADLTSDYSAGADAPAAGAPDEPLQLDAGALDVLYAWIDLGWRALDAIRSDPGAATNWSTIQLWPEHFDVGTTLDLGSGRGVNLGSSPGDAFSEEPYAYVGPWGPERPGDPAYWNAPFGAVVSRSAIDDPAKSIAFLRRGLELLGSR
jgi:hypothetical protein